MNRQRSKTDRNARRCWPEAKTVSGKALEGLLDEGRHHEAAVAGLAGAGHVERADRRRAQAVDLAVDAHGLGGELAERVLDAGVEVRGHADVPVLAEDAALAVDLGGREVDERDVRRDALLDHHGRGAHDGRAELAGEAEDAGRADVARAVDDHVEVVERAGLDEVVLDGLLDDGDGADGTAQVLGLDDARHARVHDGDAVTALDETLGDEGTDESEPSGHEHVATRPATVVIGHFYLRLSFR